MINTAYQNRIQQIHRQLGIPQDYAHKVGIDMQGEADQLVDIGLDVFERPQQLTPTSAEKWFAMQQAASMDGVELQVVSAFRSVDYQVQLIQRKLDRGDSIAEILKVNAAPGFSEHHTGCALDLTTPDCEPLCESFETTAAFAWLTQCAGQFGFSMSYPRDGASTIVYEPWHWACLVSI